MSLFICGNDSWYFYFYRFDASSPMVSSSLSPLPSGGKLDAPVRITLSNQVLKSYQVVNRLVPIVDGLNVGKCRVTSTIGEQKSFPTLCPQLQVFSSFTHLIYFKTEKASLSYPHLPQTMLCHATFSNKRVNIGLGGGGGGCRGWPTLCVFPNSPFGDSVCGKRFFGRFVGYTWVVLDRNACQLVVTNVSTTCSDVIITAIVTDSHLVPVYVFCEFVTDAILSSPFSWPFAWLGRIPISSYP